MSRAAARQSRKARLELGESWDVDYEDVEESSGSESPSTSDSELDAEEKDAPRQVSRIYALRNSPRRGPSKQQVPLSPSTRLRARISTPPSTTKRSYQSTRRTPEMAEPSFIMPSPSTQPEFIGGSRGNATPTDTVQQRTTYRRSSRQASVPTDSSPSTPYESVGASWVNAYPANMAQQSTRRRSSRQGSVPIDSPSTLHEPVGGSWVGAYPADMAQQSTRRRRSSRQHDSRPQRPASTSQRPVHQPAAKEPSPWYSPAAIWSNVLQPTIVYILSIVADVFQLLRPLIAYVVLAIFLSFLLWIGKNAVGAGIRMALSPVCSFWGVSYLALPFCPNAPAHGRERFDALVEAQTRFEDVARYSIQASGLRQDMKIKEMAMRDLRSVIGFSNLASKQEMGQILNGFILGSKQSGIDIGKWHSRIDYALDRIIALNQHTLVVADGIDPRDDGVDWTKRFFVGLGIATRPKTRKDELTDTYTKQMNGMEDEVKFLILQADSILKTLDGLEILLDQMHSISIEEQVATTGQRNELFNQLYTKLGGNRKEKSRLENNLRVLKEVQTARLFAYTLLTNALIKLRDIANYLENLREEMGRPQEDGFREIPLEVHLASIRKSVERLEDVRESSRVADKKEHEAVWGKEGGEESLITRTVQAVEGQGAKQQKALPA